MDLAIANNPLKKWSEEEIKNSNFLDKRLDRRFKIMVEQLWNSLGRPIPYACQDWANTKAAYRFLANDKVTEEKILSCHFESTKQRVIANNSLWILVIQDTTEFSYNRQDAGKIGWTKLFNSNNNLYKKCGILMHGSLAATTEGLPLGLCAVRFWTRKDFKGCNKLKKSINPMRVPIEEKESIRWLKNLEASNNLLQVPQRCIHVGDRESDIYELFCLAKELDTNFLIRSCHNRNIDGEYHKIEEKMAAAPDMGTYTIKLENSREVRTRKVTLNIKFQHVDLVVPIDKRKAYENVSVTIIDAKEVRCPKGTTPIFWRLITNLKIRSLSEAIEKITWYQQRWKIEVFHKILKSGLKAESLKFQDTRRLVNTISVFCILGWRVFWMTMINRVIPGDSPKLVFTSDEINLLNGVKYKSSTKHNNIVSEYIKKVAILGGYLARNNDPPPGNIVIWRGMQKLNDMLYGYRIYKNKIDRFIGDEIG